jgi:hypothetical protein
MHLTTMLVPVAGHIAHWLRGPAAGAAGHQLAVVACKDASVLRV